MRVALPATDHERHVRVHVTGGSGFLGTHVVPLLLRRGHSVTALARSDSARRRVTELGATALWGDLDDPESVDVAFREAGAGALVNLASLGFGHAPTIVAAAEEARMRRAVFVSTTALFTTLDVRSKEVRTAAEKTVRDSSLEWTILRPTMIYGTPRDRNMSRLLRLLGRSPIIPVPGGGRRLQQPVHVDDVAGAVAAALEQPLAVGRSYDLAGPEPLTLVEVIREAAAAVGRQPRLVPVPLWLATGIGRVAEIVLPRPPVRVEQLRRLAEDKAFDIGVARRDLAFTPRSFADGIRREASLLT